MTISLLDAVRRHADVHADTQGVAATPIAGLAILRETCPSPLRVAVSKPLVALVLQGAKRVAMGAHTFDFGAGDSLLIAADVPTVSQVTAASPAQPYYSFVIELDPAVIAALVAEMGPAPALLRAELAVRVDPTEAEVADCALRLLRLLDRPDALSLLAQPLVRELHYWLLAGRHGAAIRALGAAGSHAQRIGRAVALIRAGFAGPLRVEQLAEAAGMSVSSFHVHFRGVTSLSPLQFQKQLRLIEARRTMLADGAPIANAAFAVGYESVSQFTREYGRMFGRPPARDVRDARARPRAA
ncbi:AraC family transcriptional regulator [Massilia sp. 9096]|uniref:AraC family transcriptional regulator n=1 Tax=Massilia sp. 9096 TaxID=1500894 RepID=UPI00055C9A47|nr:AraC family transcriptional regulator [Massilia sp. 9096]